MHACMHIFPYVYTSFCTREFPTRTVQIYDAFTATRSRRVHRGQEFLNDTAQKGTTAIAKTAEPTALVFTGAQQAYRW